MTVVAWIIFVPSAILTLMYFFDFFSSMTLPKFFIFLTFLTLLSLSAGYLWGGLFQ